MPEYSGTHIKPLTSLNPYSLMCFNIAYILWPIIGTYMYMYFNRWNVAMNALNNSANQVKTFQKY